MDNNSLSEDERSLLNTLITMYNNNQRQIENLTTSNNNIRNTIINTLNVLRTRNNNQPNTANTPNTNNMPNAANTNNVSNFNNQPINGRHFVNYADIFDNLINNYPLNDAIMVNLEEFTMPFNYTFSTVLNTPANSTTSNRTLRTNGSNQIQNLFQNFMNPVEVFPTREQITNATRIVKFSDIIRPTNSSCPISLDAFSESDQVMIIRHCGHIFKPESLDTWFQSHCVCPVCRYDIRDYRHNN
jgi:hypothetical protein